MLRHQFVIFAARTVEVPGGQFPHEDAADEDFLGQFVIGLVGRRIVDIGHRAGVVQAVLDEGKPVTAAEIKRHLPPVPVRPTSPPVASPAPPPSRVLDGTGWPIPTQLIPLWLRADEVQEMLTTLSRVKGVLRAAQENKDKLFTEVNFSSALSQLDQAWADIKTAKPFAVCPTCQGQLPDQCALCRGRGLISEHRWNTCVTREDKAFREKAKARQPAGGQSKAQKPK